MILDPDYARIFTQARIIAWQYGYACVLHGSYTRDLDLLLVPWTDHATDSNAERVVRMIADACDLGVKLGKLKHSHPLDFAAKPHGRRAVSLVFSGAKDPRWVDISIMPCRPTPEATA